MPSLHGTTPLHFACMSKHKGKIEDRQNLIEFLLENGADPNNCNKHTFFTPLHWACRYGDIEIVNKLLLFGATPFTPDNKGFFPLDLAGLFNHSEIINLIVKHSIEKFKELVATNYTSPDSLLKDSSKVVSLYNFRNEFLQSSYYATKLLFWACMDESVRQEEVDTILTEMESYPEGQLTFMFKQTPLHAAALSGNKKKLQTVIEDFLERTKDKRNQFSSF